MTLRIMLVGLVASLGLELPSGSDVSSWAQAGSTWVQSKVSSCSMMAGAEVKLDLAQPSDCHQADEMFEIPTLAEEAKPAADLAFEAASKVMTADLLADQAEASVIDEAAPMVALEGMDSIGLPEGEEVGCLVVSAAADEAVAEMDEETMDSADEVDSAAGSAERPDRLSTAVRLTREAVQAWADLLQPTGETTSDTR